MLDLCTHPLADRRSVFTPSGVLHYQHFQIPTNARFIHFHVIAGGGGGQGGATGTGTNRAGGTGAGSASFATGLFPTATLPKDIWVVAGPGGTAGAAGAGLGGTGGVSLVSLAPSNSQTLLLLLANGGFGNGTGGNAMTLGTVPMAVLGHWTSVAGQAGGGGGSFGAGTSVTYGGATPLCGGAGGGGSTSGNVAGNGGTINLSGDCFYFNSTAAATSGAAGCGGTECDAPLASLGGSGGAGGGASPGGAGGRGGWGSGGGGGGGGTTGGLGGVGGQGLVVASWW